ncbi:MAG: Holliday junction resolvase RuvX [Bacillota bacterium]
MAVDPGDRRIGVAISDPSRTLAQPLCVLRWGTREIPTRAAVAERIGRLCREHDVGTVVVGLPRNMNGTLGPRAEDALAWKELLQEELTCRVDLEDERLTTRMAEGVLIEGDVSRRGRRGKVDKMAAALILQSYLARESPQDDCGT